MACFVAASAVTMLGIQRRRRAARRRAWALETPAPDLALVDGLVGTAGTADELANELADELDDELVDDPISVSSARLYGRGVGRQERMTVLRLLGLLLAEVDAGGRLRLNPVELMLLGHRHGLSADEVDAGLQWLEEVAVLERRDGGWIIAGHLPLASDPPPPIEALQAIANVLSRPPAARREAVASRGSAAVVTGNAPESEVGAGGAGRPGALRAHALVHAASRWQSRAALVGVAAAIVAGVAYVSSNGPSSRPRVITAAGVGSTATQASGQPSGTVAAGTVQSSTDLVSPSRGVPNLVVPTGSTPVTGSAITPACPQGGPAAGVDSVATTVEPIFVSSVPPDGPALDTTVSGSLRDASGLSVHVVTVLVTVRYEALSPLSPSSQTVSALSAPVTLAPGAVLPWTVSTKTKGTQTGPATATAQVTSWSWADSALATACPH